MRQSIMFPRKIVRRKEKKWIWLKVKANFCLRVVRSHRRREYGGTDPTKEMAGEWGRADRQTAETRNRKPNPTFPSMDPLTIPSSIHDVNLRTFTLSFLGFSLSYTHAFAYDKIMLCRFTLSVS